MLRLGLGFSDEIGELQSSPKSYQLQKQVQLEGAHRVHISANANAEKSQKHPLPLRHVDPHLIHQCLGPPHSPAQTTARSLYALPHKYATKSLLVTMGISAHRHTKVNQSINIRLIKAWQNAGLYN